MDWDFYLNILIPALNKGLKMSILLIIPSASLGLVLGVVTGTVRVFGGPWIKRAADTYAAIWRGTPLVVQLFILYFGLPNIGIYFSPYAAAVVGFILCSGAYHSEYIRGGFVVHQAGAESSRPVPGIFQSGRRDLDNRSASHSAGLARVRQ